jgi:glutamyl-tRNA synthetase
MTRTIVTRFAPSPTGFLHIGGARTALFNWLYARGRGGSMLLRIEDTDRERSTRELEAALLEALAWLGIDFDEGPVRQSDHHPRHRAVVEALLARGRAYRCTCTREELEARRQATIAAGGKWTYDGRCRDAGHGPDAGPYTVRLRLPQAGRLEWDDLVYGPSGQDASEVGDVILQRSDGTHLYHLAVVVDDIDQRIDTVIRGADHLLNTCIQLGIYAALDAQPPRFGHVPLLVATDGKKLSKRRDAVAVEHFREAGYLPEAVRNWLVRLGWSHGDQEIFSRSELVALFDIKDVGASGAVFDVTKLEWLSQQYLKGMRGEVLAVRLQPLLAERGIEVAPDGRLARIADSLKERAKTLVELAEQARFYFEAPGDYEAKASAKLLTADGAQRLAQLAQRLQGLADFTPAAIEAAMRELASELGLKLVDLAQLARLAVTGRSASPPIFEVLALVGRDEVLDRLRRAQTAARAAST